MSGNERIVAERTRQVTEERWTETHDLEHPEGTLAKAAGCYEIAGDLAARGLPPEIMGGSNQWPWEPEWWKPSQDAIRNYEKAGALFMAEARRYSNTRDPLGQMHNMELEAQRIGKKIDALQKS